MVLITKRMLKFSGGNWGKPDKVEKKAKLKKELFEEKSKIRTVKKRNKNKKPYISPYKLCPFCKNELLVDVVKIEKERKESKFVVDWMSEYRIKECSNCGSYEVTKKCPACGNDVWFNPITKIYMHQVSGCGFIGKLKT